MSTYTYPSSKPYDHEPIEIYDNDLKYKKYRNIDISKVEKYDIFTDARTYDIEEMDTLNYRIKECQRKYNNTMLDISHLDLQEVPINLLPHTLKYLFCSNNKIKDLGNLSHLKNLEVLDCCNNELTRLPILPSNLTEITCRDNKLVDIKSIEKCNKLDRLDCSFNKLDNIPYLNSLKILVCSSNNLSKVPSTRSLNKLICKNNKIEKLPHLHNLVELDCCHNYLREIVDYSNLKYLMCNNNHIHDLALLENLEVLQCCGNPISRIPYFDNLKELLCDYETVKEINRKYQQRIANTSINENNELQLLFY